MNSRILVVEDDPAIRLGLKRSLEFEGFTVELARDGEEAIQRAFDKKPDLIVLDIMLPRVNGFEVCRTVRKYDSTIPVLILSAKASIEDRLNAYQAAADGYISKPFDMTELRIRVRNMIRTRRSLTFARASEVITVDGRDMPVDNVDASFLAAARQSVMQAS